MTNDTLWDNIKVTLGIKEERISRGQTPLQREKDGTIPLTTTKAASKLIMISKTIEFSKIGVINAKLHRQISGKVKGIIIKHTSTNQWYACIQCNTEARLTTAYW